MDTKGNVWSGNGDGVHVRLSLLNVTSLSKLMRRLFGCIIQVWNPEGTLLGKIFLNTTSANLVFAGKGRLVILAETKIYLAKINAEGLDLASF